VRSVEVRAQGEHVDRRNLCHALPPPKPSKLIATRLRHRPHPVEAGEQLHVTRVPRDTLRPGDVRKLQRNRVVENRGAATRSGFSTKAVNPGAFVLGKKFRREKPIVRAACRRQMPRPNPSGTSVAHRAEGLAQARAHPHQARAVPGAARLGVRRRRSCARGRHGRVVGRHGGSMIRSNASSRSAFWWASKFSSTQRRALARSFSANASSVARRRRADTQSSTGVDREATQAGDPLRDRLGRRRRGRGDHQHAGRHGLGDHVGQAVAIAARRDHAGVQQHVGPRELLPHFVLRQVAGERDLGADAEVAGEAFELGPQRPFADDAGDETGTPAAFRAA
jgi:hypothetical protein